MARLPELHDALQSFSVACGRRLILLDPNSAVMAYSIHETREDRARLAYVMTHSDLWGVTAQSGQHVEVRDIEGVGPVGLLPVTSTDRHLLATLVAPVSADEDVDAMGALSGFAEFDLVRSLLQAEESVSGTLSAIASQLVADLVSGDESSAHEAARELSERGLVGSAEQYTIVVLGTGQPRQRRRHHQRVRMAASEVMRFVNVRSTASIVGGMVGDGLGVLVFPRPVQKDQLTRLLQAPDLRPVRAGIGPMAPLAELHQPFRRACWALEASTRLPEQYPTSVSWRDSGVDGYIAALPIEALTVDDLPAPLAAIVADHHALRWVDTLRTYLETGGDIQGTALAMEVHRSTIYYRLDRLGHVAGTDLTDARNHQDLLFALRLLRHLPLTT